jgi:hypothetical protein
MDEEATFYPRFYGHRAADIPSPPWYKLIRHGVMMIPALVCGALFLLCVWLGWGKKAALADLAKFMRD